MKSQKGLVLPGLPSPRVFIAHKGEERRWSIPACFPCSPAGPSSAASSPLSRGPSRVELTLHLSAGLSLPHAGAWSKHWRTVSPFTFAAAGEAGSVLWAPDLCPVG